MSRRAASPLLLLAVVALSQLLASNASSQCVCSPPPETNEGVPPPGECLPNEGGDIFHSFGEVPTGDGVEQHILFVILRGQNQYDLTLSKIATFIEREAKLVAPSSTVSFREIAAASNAAGLAVDPCDLSNKLPNSLEPFTQIWVVDLDSGSGASGYGCQHDRLGELIAGWYTNRQDIVADGRVLSNTRLHSASIIFTEPAETWDPKTLTGVQPIPTEDDYASSTRAWPDCTVCGSTLFAAGEANARPNANYFVNIFHHAVRRGNGLLFLGTDHDAFTGGINRINDWIGLQRFTGNYALQPLAVRTDPASGLFNWPRVSSHHPRIPNGQTCAERYMYDDSSTSFAPFNTQPGCAPGVGDCPAAAPARNARVLNTVAWHAGDITKPAISTTFPSGVGFVVDATLPVCPVELVQGQQVAVAGDVLSIPDGSTVASWAWDLVSLDGVGTHRICSTQSCQVEDAVAVPELFPGGAAQIVLTAQSSTGLQAVQEICVSLPRTPCPLPAPVIDNSNYTTAECLGSAGNVPDGTYCNLECFAGADLEVWEPPHCDNGVWAGGAECVPVRCHSRPPVSNADLLKLDSCRESLAGAECALANIQCNSGHALEGTAPVCEATGDWSGVPSCIPSTCNQGFFLNPQNLCEACKPGTYKAGTGAPASCTPCPVFFEAQGSAAIACTACAPEVEVWKGQVLFAFDRIDRDDGFTVGSEGEDDAGAVIVGGTKVHIEKMDGSPFKMALYTYGETPAANASAAGCSTEAFWSTASIYNLPRAVDACRISSPRFLSGCTERFPQGTDAGISFHLSNRVSGLRIRTLDLCESCATTFTVNAYADSERTRLVDSTQLVCGTQASGALQDWAVSDPEAATERGPGIVLVDVFNSGGGESCQGWGLDSIGVTPYVDLSMPSWGSRETFEGPAWDALGDNTHVGTHAEFDAASKGPTPAVGLSVGGVNVVVQGRDRVGDSYVLRRYNGAAAVPGSACADAGFGGLASAANAPDVSEFASEISLTHFLGSCRPQSAGDFSPGNPVSFTFDLPVVFFGFSTVDLAENTCGPGGVSLIGYADVDGLVEVARVERAAPAVFSGGILPWRIRAPLGNLRRVDLVGQPISISSPGCGLGHGLDDFIVAQSRVTRSVPAAMTDSVVVEAPGSALAFNAEETILLQPVGGARPGELAITAPGGLWVGGIDILAELERLANASSVAYVPEAVGAAGRIAANFGGGSLQWSTTQCSLHESARVDSALVVSPSACSLVVGTLDIAKAIEILGSPVTPPPEPVPEAALVLDDSHGAVLFNEGRARLSASDQSPGDGGASFLWAPSGLLVNGIDVEAVVAALLALA